LGNRFLPWVVENHWSHGLKAWEPICFSMRNEAGNLSLGPSIPRGTLTSDA